MQGRHHRYHRRTEAEVRQIEQRLSLYMKLTLIAALGLIYGAQVYQRNTWEHFRIDHACEATPVADTDTLGYTVSVWSCDDGKSYTR